MEKTEIYIHLMAERLAAGGNVLYMLPEIALTTQLIERMRGYFGDRVIVYHSRLTDNRRAEVYRELLVSQGGRLVIGVRSSVLLPLPRLALVVIDEEHENSFKQSDSTPRYQARDTAIVLASFMAPNACWAVLLPPWSLISMLKAVNMGWSR